MFTSVMNPCFKEDLTQRLFHSHLQLLLGVTVTLKIISSTKRNAQIA